MVLFFFFSLSEEKTQLVLNVDKQLEEVRELVCLWSVIFSSSHFLNNEFVQRGRGQFSLASDNSTCVILSVTWHADTRGRKEVSSSYDYFPVICFKVTPLWHISSHYLEVGVFMLLFKHEQSHLTETNCSCICLVMSQWLVSSKAGAETCLAMHQMHSHFSHGDIVGPVHVAAMKGPCIWLCIYLQNSSAMSHLLSHLIDVRGKHFLFNNQHWNILKLMLPKLLISESLLFSEVSQCGQALCHG